METTQSLQDRAREAGARVGPQLDQARQNLSDFNTRAIAFIREQGAGVRMRSDPKDAKSQQLVFFDEWPRPEQRLKGATAILRKLASLAGQAKAA
jgi:hypothetical protein